MVQMTKRLPLTGLWPVELSAGSVRSSFYHAGIVACWDVFKYFLFCKSVMVSFPKDYSLFLAGVTWVLVSTRVGFNHYVLDFIIYIQTR